MNSETEVLLKDLSVQSLVLNLVHKGSSNLQETVSKRQTSNPGSIPLRDGGLPIPSFLLSSYHEVSDHTVSDITAGPKQQDQQVITETSSNMSQNKPLLLQVNLSEVIVTVMRVS